ncbi:MAG TPA: sodium:solute symporter family protein [Caldithrix sp.]|nr:sodium:solute symporter family protein [Caldithrix sp.]
MTAIDFIPVALYIILLLFYGFKTRQKDSDKSEFLLSGRTLSIPAFVATLVSTWYGGILGVGEFVHLQGISVWIVFGLPYYVFALLFAFLLAPKIRQSDSYSIPDMLYQVYNKPIGLLGSVFILFMTSPAPYILMIGVLLQSLFSINLFYSVLLGTVFSMIYVYWGGFRSVVRTDMLQFLTMFAGFIMLFIFLIQSPISLNAIPDHLDSLHKSISGGLSWQEIIVWILIASWTFIDPGFHQRCSAARTPQIARKGIIISVGFWFVFDMLTLICGLYAFILLPDINPMMSFPELGNLILPPVLKGLFFTGLLATIMSTVDSYTFLSALTFGNDIVAQYKKNISESEIKKYVQWGLIITAIISIILILLVPSVIRLWYNLGSLFIPPLLLPLLSVYFPKLRISKQSTLLAMILSFGISFISFLWGQLHLIAGLPDYPFGVEPFFPGMIWSTLMYVIVIWVKFSSRPVHKKNIG